MSIVDDATYKRLREEMLARHRGELAQLDRRYLQERDGNGRRRARYGELLEVARRAVGDLPEPFSLRDLLAHPDFAPLCARGSGATTLLIKLARQGEIELVEPRRGPQPALYRRASLENASLT